MLMLKNVKGGVQKLFHMETTSLLFVMVIIIMIMHILSHGLYNIVLIRTFVSISGGSIPILSSCQIIPPLCSVEAAVIDHFVFKMFSNSKLVLK